MTELLLYLYAESPVHAGAADSLGVLDLPVQREASTGYPVIWGQSLKGALRQAATDAGWPYDEMTVPVFGAEVSPRDPSSREAKAGNVAPAEAGERELSAGLLAVGDAQLVAMPVPTLQRTFAWVTSQLAMQRLARKYGRLGVTGLPQAPSVAAEDGLAAAAHWTGAANRPRDEVLGPCVVSLGVGPDDGVLRWATRLAGDALGAHDGTSPMAGLAGKLRDDLLLVGSDVMPMLLTECTEFVARVQLTAGKTVQHGPFHSEYLPAETILAASLRLRPPAGDGPDTDSMIEYLMELLHNRLIQIGGDESLGKGLCWARLLRRDDVTPAAEAQQ